MNKKEIKSFLSGSVDRLLIFIPVSRRLLGNSHHYVSFFELCEECSGFQFELVYQDKNSTSTLFSTRLEHVFMGRGKRTATTLDLAVQHALARVIVWEPHELHNFVVSTYGFQGERPNFGGVYMVRFITSAAYRVRVFSPEDIF